MGARRVSSGSMTEPPLTYNNVLREYIDLYQHQPARQAELVVPAWALRRLLDLPEQQRLSIMGEIDHIAAAHGLRTPTKVIVATDA
jgi:hypothetical protein